MISFIFSSNLKLRKPTSTGPGKEGLLQERFWTVSVQSYHGEERSSRESGISSRLTRPRHKTANLGMTRSRIQQGIEKGKRGKEKNKDAGSIGVYTTTLSGYKEEGGGGRGSRSIFRAAQTTAAAATTTIVATEWVG